MEHIARRAAAASDLWYAYEWNQMMAMSVLGSLPILVLFLFFQKYFIAGMTAGAVK